MDDVDPRVAHEAAVAARKRITVRPEDIATDDYLSGGVWSWPRTRAGIITCTRCELRARVDHTVVHDDPRGARFLVLGEAPGEREHELGSPFTGSSGRYLRAALEKVGLGVAPRPGHAGVAFGNVNACWPHDDDNSPVQPTKSQQKACQSHVTRWMSGANAVLLVGGTAKDQWRSDVTVEGTRGEVGLWTRTEAREGVSGGGGWAQVTRLVMVVRHPSSILRAKNKTALKAELRDDLTRWARALAMLDGVDGVDGGRQGPLREMMGTRCVECLGPSVAYLDPDGLGWCTRHAFMEGERGKRAESAGLLRWETARGAWDKVKVNDHPQLGFGVGGE